MFYAVRDALRQSPTREARATRLRAERGRYSFAPLLVGGNSIPLRQLNSRGTQSPSLCASGSAILPVHDRRRWDKIEATA